MIYTPTAPSRTDRRPRGETARYERLAAEWNLAKTGGSGFHGERKPQIDLGVGRGTLHVPYALLEELRQKKGNE